MADIDSDQLANLTAEIHALQEKINQVEADFAENNNAFFMCSMALIIF
uniref:Uncharacterized protein n=1 Tax=Panagrolaimus sp. ES5 TaxID=591445 RepID=A0AC34FVC5_9BILA